MSTDETTPIAPIKTSMDTLARADWERLEHDVVKRIRLLAICCRQGITAAEPYNAADMDAMANSLILPNLKLLGAFCGNVALAESSDELAPIIQAAIDEHGRIQAMDKMAKARWLVRTARGIGFGRARIAVWNHDNPEGSAAESPVDEMMEDGPHGYPAIAEHDLGVYLYEPVYTALVPNYSDEEPEENPIGETFDTPEQRAQWIAEQTPKDQAPEDPR